MSQFAINLIWDDSVLAQPNAAAIEASLTSAARIFASNFSNPVTLNLHVGWGEIEGRAMTAHALGESDPKLVYRPYAQVAAAAPTLPANDPSGSGSVALTDIQAAALGLPGSSTFDGYVSFSALADQFVLSQGGRTPSQTYILASVFDHEVSEVMGRVAELGQDSHHANSLLDFYRFTASGVRTFTSGSAYFSTDSGATNQATFNTDPKGDDGDWSGSNSDAFNAFAVPGTAFTSQADLGVMTALGWTPTGSSWDSVIVGAMVEKWAGQPLWVYGLPGAQFQIANGATLDELRGQILQSIFGVGHTQNEVKTLYDTWMGRDPTYAEQDAWQAQVLAGADFTAVRSAILADPAGRAHTDAAVTSLYETWFRRNPSAGELAVWAGLIAGGQDFTSVRLALAKDPSSQAATVTHVTSLYETWFGRNPTGAELAVWQGLIAGGTDIPAVRAALIADPAGQTFIDQTVTGFYESYLSRAPASWELLDWRTSIAGGDSFSDVRAALEKAAAEAPSPAHIAGLYDTYLGRDPTSAELAYWQGRAAGGDSLGGIRYEILFDPSAQTYLVHEVTSLYDTYFGRDPTASELATWRNLIVYHQDDYTAVRNALLADPAGQSHATATITTLYDTYFGRDPTAGELTVWKGLIAGGDDFAALRSALVADRSGQAHTAATVTSLYDTIFARDPSAAELAVWTGLIAAGAGFDQARDTLMRDPGSSAGGVQHLLPAPGQTLAFDPAWTGAAIVGFDPLHNAIALGAAKFGAIDPLDPSHARQIAALDGSTDVLVALDATHMLLFEHTTLASLQHSDFVFV